MTRQAWTISSLLDGDRFAWLDSVAEPVQNGVHAIFRAGQLGQTVKNWLNGVPLRHRMHPALIVVPMGAWTMAFVYDALDLLHAKSGPRHRASAALAEGERRVVEVGEGHVPVLLVRENGEVLAVENWCPHAGGPLNEGEFVNGNVICPWHQSRFCLRDGAPLDGPASVPLRTFDVREAGGRITITPSYDAQEWQPPPGEHKS